MRIISYRLYTISYQIWYEFFACFFLMLGGYSHYNSVLDTDTGTGPIPSITVSRVNAYSGGVLARALPEGLRYLST